MYTIKSYGRNDLYKVIYTKSDRVHNPVVRKNESDSNLPCCPDGRLSQSLARSRSVVRDLILANDFEHFVTVTFDSDKINRWNLSVCMQSFRQFLWQYKREHAGFKYVFVPELDGGGGVHFHGVVSGIDTDDLPPWVNADDLNQYLDWPTCSASFGYVTCGPIKDHDSCAHYVTKYITKEIQSIAIASHKASYLVSRGLNRPRTVGYHYDWSQWLDNVCNRHHRWLKNGFVHASADFMERFFDSWHSQEWYALELGYDDNLGRSVLSLGRGNVSFWEDLEVPDKPYEQFSVFNGYQHWVLDDPL